MELDQRIRPTKVHAQILVKIDKDSKALEEVTRIIKDLGAHISETSHSTSSWVLFKLDVKDMRGIALKLTEHGFSVVGINALP